MGMLIARRRYLTMKEFSCQDQSLGATALTLRSSRREVMGTTFSEDFPCQDTLRAAGYEKVEDLPDLTGDDAIALATRRAEATTELQKRGLTAKETKAVIRALAALQGV